jgi:hypothetical protein
VRACTPATPFRSRWRSRPPPASRGCWQSDAAFDLKASALATASLLATPYLLDYDRVGLAVSIAFFARHGLNRGFRDYEIVLLAFYGFTLHRAMLDRSGFIVGARSVAQA